LMLFCCPYVYSQDGQRSKVLEAAKTPNPTLEKMMEAERQFVRKPSSPGKKDLSPRKQPKEKAAASPPAHGSPFFRRKDTPALGGASPRDKERSRAVFGFPLERAMELQRDTHRELSVPFVVHNLCSQVLLLGGHRSEGIFRISINSDDLDTYSKNIDRGDYKLPPKDPNYPAVLLKHYLRNLPEVTLFFFSFSFLSYVFFSLCVPSTVAVWRLREATCWWQTCLPRCRASRRT
jgi:hypothetical protein